jgi:hypothetical protein
MRRSRSVPTRAAVTGLCGLLVVITSVARSPALGTVPTHHTAASSVSRAVRFLDRMMDRRTTSSTARLVQSFTGGVLGRQHFTDAETYDNALVIDAYLADGSRASLERARVIGRALLFAQRHDPRRDGRVRAAYAPDPLRSPSALHVRDRASDVGDIAWAGLGLARLARASGERRFLDGAERIARWVVRHCKDSRGAGGFTGGLRADGSRIRWKSTEHNLDLFALFRSLAKQTGRRSYRHDARWAERFVHSMWHRSAGDFYVGTGTNGRTPNTSEAPEDVNSWSYLALRDPGYRSSVDWDVGHLSVSGPGYAGVSFCRGDRSGAWYEGTAHLADALRWRANRGDARKASRYLGDIRQAQGRGPDTRHGGIVAASKDRLGDCDGDFYYRSLHTGATAWYILAADRANPFR